MEQGDAGPKLRFPSPFNIAVPLIDRHLAEGQGGKAAILTVDETIDYQTLAANVNRYGNALLGLGLHPGDQLLMVVKDAPEFYYTFWGCIKAGIIPVPLNTMLTPSDYQFIISDSGARALVYSAEFRVPIEQATSQDTSLRHLLLARHGTGSLDDLASRAAPTLTARTAAAEDDCFHLYSSGTTGRPKGIIHLHRDIAATCILFNVGVVGGGEDDVYYSIPRLFFAFGLGFGMTFPLWVGGTAVLDARRPTPGTAIEIFRRFKPTLFAAVPTFLAALLDAPTLTAQDLAGLRRCISGGEPLPEVIQTRWREVATIPITDGIGSTEALNTYIANRIDDVRPGSSGRIVPGYSAKILDENGEEILDDRPGRLWISGPSVTERYWNNPEKTKASIVDGWLDSGDTYRRDSNGYYYYCGRSDDMLKVGGIWVSQFEIEFTLLAHPDVLEVAVVGRTDESGMTKPEAWVVPRNPEKAGDSLADDLLAHCKKTMAPYKYPRWINFIEKLPRTATGKIQRFKLRE
jgi:benzoate-CoA ligase family protein